MAHFRKKKGKWYVEIKKKGHPRVSKAFISKDTANKFAKDIESQMEKGLYQGLDNKITLRELLIKYRDEVVVNHKACRQTTSKINQIIKNKISSIGVWMLKSSHLYQYKKELSETKAPQTVKIYLTLIKAVWNTAIKVWSIHMPVQCPCDLVVIDKFNNTRDITLSDGEYNRLLDCAKQSSLHMLHDLINFAYLTSARYSEIVNLKRIDADFKKQLITFRDTKNKSDRTIAISSKVIEILKRYPFGDTFFRVPHDKFVYQWNRCRAKAGLKDFRFHDLRSAAIRNMLLSGMSLAEVQVQSGHRSIDVLTKRYARIKALDLVEKIEKSAK